MGQAEVAIIAVVCFAAGILARHAWPLFVAWQDRKLFERQVDSWQSKLAVKEQIARATLPTENPPQPRRRVGLAESRARKEFESLKPVEHQARVTQNNIQAMEGK